MRASDVRVREDGLVHIEVADQRFEVLLRIDRDPLGILRAGQKCRVAPVVDPGNLGRRETDDLVAGVIAVHGVEVVKISARRPENEHSSSLHRDLPTCRAVPTKDSCIRGHINAPDVPRRQKRR